MAAGIKNTDVTAWSQEPESPYLTSVVKAVNDYVAALPVTQHLEKDAEWPAAIKLGAIMLAARLARRRNSPNGLEAVTDLNVTYTARYDSDIARLLQLDGFQKPAVG